MVLRATFIAVRAASLIVALAAFLLGQLFLPGALLGAQTPDASDPIAVSASLVYSFCAGLGTFLVLFAFWTYRVQRRVVRVALVSLLFARLTLLVWVVAGAAVLAACLVWSSFAAATLRIGATVALIGLGLALLVKGHRFAPYHAPHRAT